MRPQKEYGQDNGPNKECRIVRAGGCCNAPQKAQPSALEGRFCRGDKSFTLAESHAVPLTVTRTGENLHAGVISEASGLPETVLTGSFIHSIGSLRMGQRLLVRTKARVRAVDSQLVRGTVRTVPASLSVFETDLGWFGLIGREDVVMRLFFGHASAEEVRTAAARAVGGKEGPALPESDWYPELRRRLMDFARGVPTNFDDVKLDLDGATEFRERVLKQTRKIKYGSTVTYGQLAARAGKPAAARAIGAVMASNRVPIIIPCHRVVGSGGSLGGFSAPQGIALSSAFWKWRRHAEGGIITLFDELFWSPAGNEAR